MAGGVPNSSLGFATSGVDGLLGVMVASASYISPFLYSGMWSSYAANAKVKSGEQIAIVRRPTPGTMVQSQNTLESPSFASRASTEVSAMPVRIKNTALIGSASTAIYTDTELHMSQGVGYAADNPYMSDNALFARSVLMADLRSMISSVARDSDKLMFQSIFGTHYTRVGNAIGTVTGGSETFSQGMTHHGITQTANFKGSGSPEEKAIAFLSNIKSCVTAIDSQGLSISSSYKMPIVLMPEPMYNEAMSYLSLIRGSYNRINADRSDGSFNMVQASVTTMDGITFIGLPYKWFYTLQGASSQTFIGLVLTQDAVVPYCPLQYDKLVKLGLDVLSAQDSSILDSNLVSGGIEYFVKNESDSAYGALSVSDIQNMSRRYNDPMIDLLIANASRRHPELNLSSNMMNSYNPLSYRVYTYAQGPNPTPLTSYGRTMEVTRFAGAVRALPSEIVPLFLPTNHYNNDFDPSYSNPLTATYVALQTVPASDMARWITANKEHFLKETKDNPKLISDIDAVLRSFDPDNCNSMAIATRDVILHRAETPDRLEEAVKMVNNTLAEVSSTQELRKFSSRSSTRNNNEVM